MKTVVKLMLCAVLLAVPYFGFAQYGYTKATNMDVNGIFIGGTYTKAQMTAQWGTPTQYRSSMSEFGLDETYRYSNNVFRFGDNGIFHSFHIWTSNFVVYTAKSGGFKVGDDISRIRAIGLPSPLIKVDGTGVIQSGDDWFTFGHSNDKITWISFVTSI